MIFNVIQAFRHLHGYSQGKHLIVILPRRVVRDDHAIGDDHPRAVRRAREEAHGVARIHDQGLLLGHGEEVVKGEPELKTKQNYND